MSVISSLTGSMIKGMNHHIPCELIDRNGDTLKEVVSGIPENGGAGRIVFRTWLESSQYF